jgi:DUF1365 family protein
MPPVPALVPGMVAHGRATGVRHAFRHRAYLWLVDLDDLPRLPWYLRPLASFRSADHLGSPDVPLRRNLRDQLAARGVRLDAGARVLMLAGARVFGYVFNPLTVYWCLDSDGVPECVLAEVHNTYGQRHAYLLRPDRNGEALVDKDFYVSPFFEVDGAYRLRFDLSADRVGAQVELLGPEGVRFTGSFSGRPVPATRGALLRTVLLHPLMPQRVSALIRMHGVWLWLRRLPVVPRPDRPRQKGV